MTTTTPATKTRRIPTCNRKIKNDDLELIDCKSRLGPGPEFRCPNRKKHVSKYLTGFCAKGWCEGSNPKTWSGKPAPTCKSWDHCPCKCHTLFDMMFSESGLPREVVNNSEYHAPKGEFWVPTPEERMALIASSRPGVPDAPQLIESPLPDAVPATIRRSYTPTTTGRAARGELEAWVKDECDVWLVEKEDFPCTPAYLAEEIGRKQGIKPPSVGAISAVFDRWTKIGFAFIYKKPTRFTGYTPLGIALGLEGCKEKAKRTKKLQEKAGARTLR